MKSKLSITLDEKIIKSLDKYIDGVNIRNRSQAIEFFISKHLSQNRIAVILASKIEPFRILAKIKGQPLIMHTVKLLQSYNFKKLFVIGEKEILSQVFTVLGTGQEYLMSIEYVEDVNPKGSAASLSLLKNKVDSTFLVVPADNFFNTDINSFWTFHVKSGKLVNLAISAASNPTKLGIIDLQGGSIVGFEQKPKKSTSYLIWTGIMICEPEILYYNCNSIEKDLIPKLILTRDLGGFVFAGQWKNIHTKKDIEDLR
ncbi:Nucleotidyl transferase [Candidatus Tiddalikarchaeum anstoanum]|nr:Nucleotidyl transferase [Candidatus Tiddalikarchaeum anstoanum]